MHCHRNDVTVMHSNPAPKAAQATNQGGYRAFASTFGICALGLKTKPHLNCLSTLRLLMFSPISPATAPKHFALDNSAYLNHPSTCVGRIGFPRSGQQGRESWRVKVPLPSIARFRRLAYPLLGEETNRDMRGSKSHGCPVYGSGVGSLLRESE